MVMLACVVLLVAGTAFARWPGDRFPAGSQGVAGTPVELRVQDGVTARELRAIRDGVVLMDRYIERSLGRRVQGPVEARVARRDRCRHDESGERSLIGQARAGFLCVDTANIEWKVLVSTDRPTATAVSAHEYAHVLQAELGCLPEGESRDYRWIVEGMATDLAWRALVRAGRVTDTRVRRTISRDRPFDPGSRPLPVYEREGGRPPQYALWHLAIRFLLRAAVDAGAAPAARPEVALGEFCERVGAGRPWRAAFAESFGLRTAELYARFEASRP
jgi:hypothetical protein